MSSNGWQETTLGDLVETLDSRRRPVKRTDRRPGPYPYYGASGIVDHVEGYLFDGEYLLVAEDGENLNSRKTPVAFIACGKFWVNNHAHVLQGRLPADTRFLAYYIEASDIAGYVTGSAQPKLSQGNLHRMRLFVPPPRERAAIARILGALDDKAEQNRRTGETLESICQALFNSWFVDFDPVVAKAEGRHPMCISAAVAELFPSTFEETTRGTIPRGWSLEQASRLVEANPVRRLRRGEVVPYLDMQNMPTHSALPEDWVSRAFSSGMKFQNGDTLVARITPCLENGKTAFVNFLCDGQVGWGSTEFIVLHARPPHPESYSYFLARTEDFRAHCIANMTGSSGRQRVPASSLDSLYVARAPEPVVRAFGDVADAALNQMRADLAQSRTLAALRDALLPRLLSGELRVRQAEKLVEEAI